MKQEHDYSGALEDLMEVASFIDGAANMVQTPPDGTYEPASGFDWELLQAAQKIVGCVADIRVALTAAKGDGWLPIESAPKDESDFLLRKVYPEITEHWTARYEKPYKEETQDGVEYGGHLWILNDDEKQLVVGDEDFGYEWQPLPKPPQDGGDEK